MSESAFYPVILPQQPAPAVAPTTAEALELKVVISPTAENPDLGDLWLAPTGDEVLIYDLAEAVAQRLTVRFNFFLGEWFLDTTEGTPWFQRVLVKAPSDRAIRTVLNDVISKTEGVASVSQLTYSISKDRQLSVDFKAILQDGSTFQAREYGRFVVDLLPALD